MEQTPIYLLARQDEAQIVHNKEDVDALVSQGWIVVAAGSRPKRSALDALVDSVE
jgi:hypothetical protein